MSENNFVTKLATGDGSDTLRSTQFGVTYHSIHGALQETQHVFIEAGLVPLLQTYSHLRILEIGFGTGLNAFMTFLYPTAATVSIDYEAYEAYPVPYSVVSSLNYVSLLQADNHAAVFTQMHTAALGEKVALSHRFNFTLQCDDVTNIRARAAYDLIYFDAFAPTAQPELWDEAMLQRMYDALSPGGALVTYCAKGVVKRTLKKVGFTVEALPGPPRKREMTRALKK